NMPLIAVNLSDKIIQEIRELVDKGRYISLESFIEIGAFNQLALERGATPAEIIERGHRRGPSEVLFAAAQSVPAKTKPNSARPPSADGAKKTNRVKKAPRVVDVIEQVTEEEAKEVFARW